METSLTFYVDICGMKVLDVSLRQPPFSEKVTGIKEVMLKIAYLEAGSFKVELIEYIGAEEMPSSSDTFSHLCFNVTGLREFFQANRSRVEFVNEPLQIPTGPNRNGFMVYLFDPDHNKIELIESGILND